MEYLQEKLCDIWREKRGGTGSPRPGGGGVATLPGCVFPKVKDMGRFAA